jgi:serine protein kinase
VSYTAYEPLKEAIEKKLMSSVRDISRIITKARTRDEEQKERYDRMVETLIENGYPEATIDTILKYAANHLWKD